MINGILNVYKEKGYTSHDVVAKLRGITGQKKIGHTGTLDPEATGVLPVCLGKGTKLVELLTDEDKAYEAVLLLGRTTDTQDLSGEILSEKSTEGLTEEEARAAILSFQGGYDQVPPMYSALKVNGKKLYELARSGQVVERKARPVKLYEIRVLEMKLPRVRFSVTCSKGTYIRTLCHDIGERLSCGGCMEELSRTRVGRFSIEASRTLEEIRRMSEEGRVQELVVPVEAMFDEARKVLVKAEWEKAARNGNTLPETAVEEIRAEDAPVPSEEPAGCQSALPEEGVCLPQKGRACCQRALPEEGAGLPQKRRACCQRVLPEEGVCLPQKEREESAAALPDGARVRLYGSGGQFIALYIWKEGVREYHLEKMFFPEK